MGQKSFRTKCIQFVFILKHFSPADAQLQDIRESGTIALPPQQVQSVVSAIHLAEDGLMNRIPQENAKMQTLMPVPISALPSIAAASLPAQMPMVPADSAAASAPIPAQTPQVPIPLSITPDPVAAKTPVIPPGPLVESAPHSVQAPLISVPLSVSPETLPAATPIVPVPSIPLQTSAAPLVAVRMPAVTENSNPTPAQMPVPAASDTSSLNATVSVADKTDNELKPPVASEHMLETNDKKNAENNSIDGDSNAKSISQTTLPNTDLGLGKAQILRNNSAIGSENVQNVVSQYVAQKDSTGDTSNTTKTKDAQPTKKVDTAVTDVGQPVPVIVTPMGTFPTATRWFPSRQAIEDGSTTSIDAAQKMERLIR